MSATAHVHSFPIVKLFINTAYILIVPKHYYSFRCFVINLELMLRMVRCGDACGARFFQRLVFLFLSVGVGMFCLRPVNFLSSGSRYLPVVVEHPNLFDVDRRPLVAAFDISTCEASYDRQVFEKCLLHDSNLAEYAAATNVSWRSVLAVSMATRAICGYFEGHLRRVLVLCCVLCSLRGRLA
jgi:hypothetical protein